MTQRGAPSLLTIATRALGGEVALERGAVLLVGVSGGPDSMALLHVLTRLAPRFDIELRAHGVDHGLRADAAEELDLAEALARSSNVAFDRTLVHVARGGNLQARARTARYDALARAARAVGASAIATAHHADDRAETVLMRLMRGAGPRGLAVLPPRAPLESHAGLELVRPLLRARRDSIRAHLARHHLAFATDPSNVDPRFLRVRVRHELLPLLEQLAPGIVDHLVALADQLRALDIAPSGSYVLPRASQTALAALVRSASPDGRVWLPGGLVATVDPRARPSSPRRKGPGS